MKCLLLNDSFEPYTGGIETYLKNIARALEEVGHEVFVAYSKGYDTEKNRFKFFGFKGDFLFPIIKIITLWINLYILRKKLQPDVVIVRNVIWGLASIIIFGNKKTVYIAPAVGFIELSNRVYQNPIVNFWFQTYTVPIFRLMEMVLFQKTSKIVCFSTLMYQSIKKYFHGKECFILHPGVDTNRFTAKHRNINSSSNHQSITILTVARLSGIKNIGLTIAMMNYLPENYKYIVIGEGREREKLLLMIKNYKLDSRVQLLGSKKNVEQYYNNADVYVHPAYYESFGHVFLEAMATGLPIIVGESSPIGAKDIMKNEVNCKVVPLEAEQFANAVLDITSHLAKYQDMSKNNAKSIREHYTWEVHARKLIEYIQN